MALASRGMGGVEGEGWPSCPGTAETIRSLHLEDQQMEEQQLSSGRNVLGEGGSSRGQPRRRLSSGQLLISDHEGRGELPHGSSGGLHGSIGSQSHHEGLVSEEHGGDVEGGEVEQWGGSSDDEGGGFDDLSDPGNRDVADLGDDAGNGEREDMDGEQQDGVPGSARRFCVACVSFVARLSAVG